MQALPNINNSRAVNRAIAIIRKKLKQASAAEVAAEMNCKRQTIYYHLNMGSKANLAALTRIAAACDKIIARNEQQQIKALKKLIA